MTDREDQIFQQFQADLQEHLDDLNAGRVDQAMEVEDFARKLFICPRHLSDTISDVAGNLPVKKA